MKAGWRAALALLSVGLAGTSVLQFQGYRRSQDRLGDLARSSGVLAHEPGLIDGISREPDRWHARLRLARTLFASGSAASAAAPVEAVELDGSSASMLRRLELAHRLAASVALERPSSWEAQMIQGASMYLSWSSQRDRRLLTEPEEWEAPLLRALKVAPGRPEPARFLSAAYLELWPVLGSGKKEEARVLLSRALTDRRTFEALVEPWLRTADSRGQAYSAIPPEPWAWERLQQIEARDSDWEGYRAARVRWYQTLTTAMRANLAEAEARLRGGDESRAHLLFLHVMQVPPRQRFLAQTESALAQCPAGPGGGSFGPSLQAWLDWSLDLCLWKGCPLPQPMLRRLAGLAGTIDDPTAAWAAVLSGDLPAAEVLVRRASQPWSAPWGPYGIARARTLTQQRKFDEATRALDGVHPSWKRTSPYWLARLVLARARADVGLEAEARGQLEALKRSAWSYQDWAMRKPAPRLEMVPAGPAGGLTIEILEAPDLGTGVEVRLNGEVAAITGARRGDVLRILQPLQSVPYLLEIEAVSGGVLVPGTVRLLAAAR